MTSKQKQELIDYLDKEHAAGKEIKLCWEGGGDSGWVWFEIDGNKISENGGNQMIDSLVDYMYDTLDYGSWAGEFSANGEAEYDSKTKEFSGTDYYSEDETINRKCNIKLSIPKSLWFDVLEIEIQGEEPNIDAVFHIKNGFLIPEHTEFIDKTLIPHLQKETENVIESFINDDGTTEYRSMWEHFELEYADFKDEGDYMTYEIKDIGVGTYTTDEKSIYLDLNTLTTTDEAE